MREIVAHRWDDTAMVGYDDLECGHSLLDTGALWRRRCAKCADGCPREHQRGFLMECPDCDGRGTVPCAEGCTGYMCCCYDGRLRCETCAGSCAVPP